MALDALFALSPRDVDPNRIAPRLLATQLDRCSLQGTYNAHLEQLRVHTRGAAPAFFDVTELVSGVVERSGVAMGQVVVTTAHTTCAIIVQENEPCLLADLADRLGRFAHQSEAYRHNDMEFRTVNLTGAEERANGHSHCQHALLGASVSLPVMDGQPRLGIWQRVLLVELDHPRPRDLSICVQGVSPAASPDAPGES